MIYKILREDEYMELVIDGEFKGAPADLRDGYIHFSTKSQLAGTLAKHFEGEEELHLIAVDEGTLKDLKWEPARGGDLFPHLFQPLQMGDVIDHWILDAHKLPRSLP